MKYRLLFLLLLSVFSCYRVQNIPDNAKPVFDVQVDLRAVTDTTNVLPFTQNLTNGYLIVFTLDSGNPVNYQLSCFFAGLPAGITDSPSTCSFKLPTFVNMALQGTADTGIYGIYLDVVTPTDTIKYPLRMHVSPG